MTEVIALRFRYNPKQLWFEPAGLHPEEGDHILVETERGTEIGLATSDVFEIDEDQRAQLPTALKPIIRIATEEDLATVDELAQKGQEAMPVFRELVKKYELDMKPVRVEYLFSGDKAIFYFASEERVDFRDLVRDLASRFHIRVDMRQIGVRDEARLVGGIAHCGQELCCARLGGEFHPVSIRMAKEQDLPLNPLKISGLCGRLMCCLRYEFEAYKDFKTRAPKRGALIETPLGLAKVMGFDTPLETVEIRLEDGKRITVPLGSMDADEAATTDAVVRPSKISAEAMETCLKGKDYETLFAQALDRDLEDGVVDNDPAAHHRQPRRRGSGEGAQDKTHADTGSNGQRHPDNRKPRRRRQGTHSDDAAATKQGGGQGKGKSTAKNAGTRNAGQKKQGNRSQAANGQRRKQESSQHAGNAEARTERQRPRPGQNSSGIRGSSSTGELRNSPTGGSPSSVGQAPQNHRRPRRRHSASSPNSPQAGSSEKNTE